MVDVDLSLLKQLRLETGASIADCRRALEENINDYKKSLEWIKKNALSKAEKKSDRETSQGLIETYLHGGGRVGVMVEILCETDFVAKTDDFKHLAHEVAMQIAAMDPKNVGDLMKEEYIRDNSQTIEQLVKGVIGKLGENITIKRFQRFSVGE